MTRYIELTKEEFESGLRRITSGLRGEVVSLRESTPRGTEEYVYTLTTKHPRVDIKVYSSVSKRNNVTRSSGKDAIRCVVDYKGTEIFKGTAHTKRLSTWETNLYRKIESLLQEIPSVRSCPKCNSVMTVRKSYRGKFWGCTSFPRCKHTENY